MELFPDDDKIPVQCLKNWRIPRDFAPEQITASTCGFYLSDGKKVIKFSGHHRSTSEDPEIVTFEELHDGFVGEEFAPQLHLVGGDILGAAQSENGWIIFRRNSEGNYSLNFCSTAGEVQKEIKFSDLFEDDYLTDLCLDLSHFLEESQMQSIVFSGADMKFLTKYLNTDASHELLGREIVLFSMGSSLNVLQRNQEDEWEVALARSFAEEIKCLWYSTQWEAIFVISSLGVVKVTYLVGHTLKEETIFLDQKYLSAPKLLCTDKLIGITWTAVDIIRVEKSEKFSFPIQRISLPGVVDVIHHTTWDDLIAVTENKFIYVIHETLEMPKEKKFHENWRKNREKFKEYIESLMESSSRITREAKEDNHILNCLGFLRNFFISTHEVTLTVSLRQTLGTNVEIEIQPSQKIAQMDFSRDSQWTLSVFNGSFCERFALKSNQAFAFMLPEEHLMASPLRVEISVEFHLEGEHFMMAFPLRVVFRVQGAPPESPLMDFYSKMEALARTSIEEYANHWAQTEQLNEKKLSSLALKLHQMVVAEPPLQQDQLQQVYKELRTKDADL